MAGFDGSVANIKVATKEEKKISNGSLMTKITDADGKKYSFFNKKKDGSNTAAYLGFQGVSIDDVVEIGFKEEEKEFVGEEGKNIKYTQRTILFANKVVEDGNYEISPDQGKVPTYPVATDIAAVVDEELPF